MAIVSASLNVKRVAGVIEAILGDWRGKRNGIAYVVRCLQGSALFCGTVFGTCQEYFGAVLKLNFSVVINKRRQDRTLTPYVK